MNMTLSVQTPITEILESADLPTPSAIAVMVLECKSDPDWSLPQVTNIVRNDQALVARLTQAAASLIPNRQPESVEEAITWIGRNATASIALSTFLKRTPSSHQAATSTWRRRFWQRAVIQGTTASVLATSIGDDPGRYFLSGLMSNVGALTLLQTRPKEYAAMLAKHSTSFSQLRQAELHSFGFTHTELSQALLQRWGIHDSISDALDEDRSSAVYLLTEPQPAPEALRLTAAVYIASRIAALYDGEPPSNGSVVIESLTRKYFHQRLEFVLKETFAELCQIGPALGIDCNRLKSPEALRAQAEDGLSAFLTGGFSPD